MTSSAQTTASYHTVIAGGGIAGLVTALVLLEQGVGNICIVDRDSPERLGGLARWAFGGMALCGTKEQQRARIPDNPKRLLEDWQRFGEMADDDSDYWPKCWAREYAERNHQEVYLWLQQLGMRFLPAVNWVERGLFGDGNSVPRYHVLWGTGWDLVENIIDKLQPFIKSGALKVLSRHRVLRPLLSVAEQSGQSVVCGAEISDETAQKTFTLACAHLVIASGGINGSTARVRQNWPRAWGEAPQQLLNGANPISDGQLHDAVNAIGGNITHVEHMWNYAAGIRHPQAEFDGHGLSLIPCKSALWLDHRGRRIGPQPLVTGFDTRYLCEQVARQEKPWSWQLLNWRIAAKELAVSGSLHNPSIRDHKWLQLLRELLFGNHALVKKLLEQSDDVLCADTLAQLVQKMNAGTEQPYIELESLQAEVARFDRQFAGGLENDEQLRRIHHARQWRPDRLRTCKPKPLLERRHGPLLAFKVQLISRKSLGGIQTNLASQVLDQQGQAIPGLYSVGEAAGFGGGGASGVRSLEGTFLSGCILTAKNAAAAILAANNNDNKVNIS